jgi:hypothetical protein
MTQPKGHDLDDTYTRLLKKFTEMDVPKCPLCRATDTASVQVGIIGLTIRLEVDPILWTDWGLG